MVPPVRHLVSALLLLPASLAAAQSVPAPQHDGVAAPADLRASTRLSGHVPHWATPANDAGEVPADAPLRLTFTLARSPERHAAFTQLLADQQDPASPSFHHWLTPQQIGTLYGPTQNDVDALTAWLTAQHLAVTDIAPSRIFLTVEAPAATVAQALGITFRYFHLPGAGDQVAQPRLATTTEPSVPTALAPLILAITGLADTPVHPMFHSQSAPMPKAAQPTPLGTSVSTGRHYITPGDFAVLYDLNPVYSAGFDGTGQRVAIVGRSRVDNNDIKLYESLTGVPIKYPAVIVPPTGVDPGVANNDDQDEATLDADRVLATAPGVQADLIVATAASGGINLAAQYNVQTLLDRIMTISFNTCEANSGQSGVTMFDTLFAQAAAEGISVFVSSGDSGAANCQPAGQTLQPNQLRGINAYCASSYVTCVGGTEFNDTASPATYWSPTNSPTLQTALSSIPEGAWNEPQGSSGTAYVAYATGGGASAFLPKPAWQTGTGVPADGARDVPDISFSASYHNAYLVCLVYKGQDCATVIGLFSGTSVGAPAMAGIAALLNQKTGGAQGNLNPLLYKLAATTPAAFHDATPATSGVATCDVGAASMCNNSLPSTTGPTGGVAGYALTAGYDLATGLGSLDVNSFLTAYAATETLALTPATASLSLKGGATSGNTDLITLSSQIYGGTAHLACTVAFNGPGTATSIPICSMKPADVTVASNGSASSLLSFATTVPHLLRVSAPAPPPTPRTRPVAPIALAALSVFVLLPLTRIRRIRPLATVLILLSGLGTLAACSGSSTPAAANPLLISTSSTALSVAQPTIFAGAADTFTVTVSNNGFNTTVTPTGTLQFFLSGNASPVASATLAGGTATAAIPFPSSGTYTVYAAYAGDTNFSASSSGLATVAVMPTGTTPGSYTVTVKATTPNGPAAATTVALTIN